MGLFHLALLLTLWCATLAWVPREFDQDRSKTRRYGVLDKWNVGDPGIMMNPEMVNRPNRVMEEHQVPLLYDDDFAEPDGPYPKRVKDQPYQRLAYSVDGAAVHIKPRPNLYNLFNRGKQNTTVVPESTKPRLNAAQMLTRYAWPRAMDRANNRANLEHTENGVLKPRKSKPPAHPNDF